MNNKESLKNKLIELGSEALADALIELAGHSDEASDLVGRLVATPKENVERFKAKLSALKKSRRFYDWREVSGFARDLEGLLADLSAGVQDPKTGVELVSAFFECDRSIFESCDDSSGSVGSIFSFEALNLFVHYAAACNDKKWICELLVKLCEDDDYGVRDVLFDSASEFLPVESLRELADLFWTISKKEKSSTRGARHWLSEVETLARQLGDAALFEKARLASWPELSTVTCLDVAQVYLYTDDAHTALSWMERITQTESFREDDRYQLLLSIYEKLGDKDKKADIAWRIFLRYRSTENLKTLLNAIGEDKRDQVMEKQVQEILKDTSFSTSNAAFLIDTERMDDANVYIMNRADQLNGDLYFSLLPFAESMEKEKYLLAAIVIYRALLDSILRRAQSKYYHHGVRYLKKVDKLSPKITDWHNIPSHQIYKEELSTTHSRKRAFWSKYNA